MSRKARLSASASPHAGIARRVLAWYDAHARMLPWRVGPGARSRGRRADPYKVWLSEIMLQQTTAAAVAPRFEAFLARFPDLKALAGAPAEAVLEEWAGLGYYARARNLHKCARAVVDAHSGRFPETAEGLRALPGIGPYTAGAIAAIAFDAPESAVDGNVERVVARLFAVETPLPAAKPELRSLADRLVPRARPGDFAQAMMDLGATVCTPRNPTCGACPLSSSCQAFAQGIAAELPRRAAKAAKPHRYGIAYVVRRNDGAVLLRRRPARGLLGGMLALPCTPFAAEAPEAGDSAPAALAWREAPQGVRHTFTHFHLSLAVCTANVTRARALEGEWADDPYTVRLPTVMRKALDLALAGAD